MTGLELLFEEDREFILRKGWDVEVTKTQENEIQVVIRNFSLSAKYAPRQTDILIRIMPGYPDTLLDMFWTNPVVVLAENNQPPQATEVRQEFQGREWQRWSRHMNGWRPGGLDNLESFYAAAMHKELTT